MSCLTIPQLWRLLTPFLTFGKPGFQFLMFVMMLYKFGGELESNPYPSGGGNGTGNSADYLFMLIFGGVVLLVRLSGVGGCFFWMFSL